MNDWILAYLILKDDFTQSLQQLLRMYAVIAVLALIR